MENAASNLIGKQISRYRLLARLGAGGMGEVFLAEDSRLNRKIAVKLLPETVIGNAERLRRFEQEARAASALNHPNILTIYEIGEADGAHFIAAEYVAGETLRERLARQKMILSETLDAAAQIVSALQAAHIAGVVHRDIKPENLMIRDDGLIKVLDFGLAKLVEKSSFDENPVKTQIGVILGTAAYMSPEQARGLEIDARTDIFSFGSVLYEMLTGKRPFSGASALETVGEILYKEPAVLDENRIPVELRQIAAKCLRKNRDERYQTTADLLADLKNLQKRLLIEAEIASDFSTRSSSKFKTQIQQSAAKSFATGELDSIAVLPFANISADEENEYFCDGLAEELSNALAKIEGLKVAARTSAFSFKNKTVDVGEIGSALNVKTVLEGSVRKSGNKIRITVQLVNAADGFHLWSERFDREMRDIFEIQDEITGAVVKTLKVKLLGDAQKSILHHHTINTQAYELYLKGLFYRGKGETESRRKAVECFQAAIELDSFYAPAFAELSFSYRVLIGGGILDPKEYAPKAEAMAHEALRLDEESAEAHFALAILLQDRWQWREAETEFRRAVQLNPGFARAHTGYAGYLSRIGRHEQAVAEIKFARELDPLSPIVNANLGFILYFARRHDEAVQTLKETLELNPDFAFAHLYLGYNFAAQNQLSEAIAEYQTAIRLGQDTPSNRIYLGAAYARSGKRKKAGVILKELETGANYVSPGELAVLYTALGDFDAAFASLERAYEARDLQLQFLKVDPAFDRLRTDARFQNLLDRIGFPG